MKIFITGGIGSGKSSFALHLAEKISKQKGFRKKIFIAPAEPRDEEMTEKIKKHKEEREKLGNWMTIEEPYEIHKQLKDEYEIIVLDCLTMWITNIFFKYQSDTEKINSIKKEFILSLKKFKNVILIVSNETGLGIIPSDKQTREWSKHLSHINREVAKISNQAYLIVSGIPIILKGNSL
ncbi:MAG: bifunctional adenosylcobinamide kinase/adenosylcobinamide-phosphate guanylyltransferase [Candidatus Calescibacterium sp.]|nr:bifunctional adenosylcobinamide kinase/adenosylcobinamide-phosphate guanylyltransferase [Candidatus Calescibacterium sp.]